MQGDWVWEFEDGAVWLSRETGGTKTKNDALYASAKKEFLRRCKPEGPAPKLVIRRRKQGEQVRVA